jgi:protein-disulfide isomerase
MSTRRPTAVQRLPRRTLLAVAVAIAVAVTAALVVAGQLGVGRDGGTRTTAVLGATGDRLLAGIPQRRNSLGAADAPVTLVEYADLQCPYCGRYATNVLPELIRTYVRAGHVRLVFRGLAFIGPDSVTAVRAVVAAGKQDRLWDVMHLLYANQGTENSGWVTPDLLRSVGDRVPGLDTGKMLADADGDDVSHALAAFGSAATTDGVASTPSFMVGRTGGRLEPLHVSALEPAAFAPTLDGLLAE